VVAGLEEVDPVFADQVNEAVLLGKAPRPGPRGQVLGAGDRAQRAARRPALRGPTVKGKGRITEITDTTLTFTSKKASELKVDAEVVLEKGPAAMTGC
jgi:hypothetical protein